MRPFAIAMLLALGVGSAATGQESLPKLTIASQASGTVNWELQTILEHELDEANGFDLEIMEVASKPAAEIAFQGGSVDMLVTDWIWVARQRAEGVPMSFIPYSRAVGGVMVPADSKAGSLADLAGEQIGIAGGPLDKSWLILRAYALEALDFDLASETTQVFGAPPIMFQAALDGEVAAVINFWHFMARQEAAGMRHLIDVAEALAALGIDSDVPLLGYVVMDRLVEEQSDLVAGFAAASRAAKELLADDDAEWERLKPLMNAEDEAQFEALRAGWRAGIPGPGPVDEEAAGRLLAIMADLGGEELVGRATSLPEGVFVRLAD
ncbi:MAG: ABC transporter substrate-binding protein [Geminicoccaceae bacterium]|nr:ABC transporter substrate-binding protein [Geminicoccaceae bacterium]